MKNKKYDDVIFIKLPSDLKEKAKLKSEVLCKNISEYIRDLIIKDTIGD